MSRAIVIRSGCRLGVLVATLALPARAQNTGDKAAAEALFEQARALEAEKKFDEACAKFELSQQLDAGVGTLLYLADCYEQSGKLASAWATFKEAAAAARAAGETDRSNLARGLADALEPKLSKLSIGVADANAIDGFEVRRDGQLVPRGLWSVPIPVDPGKRHIEARAPGKKPWTGDAIVDHAGVIAFSVPALEADPNALKAAGPPPVPPANASPAQPSPVPPRDARTGGGTQRSIGFAVGAAGVVGLGVAALFAVKAKSKDSDASSHCPNDQCDPQGVQLGNEARSAANTATALSLGGLVALAGGIVLELTAPSSSPASAALRPIGLTADLAPGRFGVGVSRAW